MAFPRSLHTLVLAAGLLLAGCDMLGIESPEKIAAARENDGKAIGGACRHAGRAIEDCYALNRKADRSAVFAGWREMNDYMRENKLDAVAPQIAPGVAGGAKADAGAAADDEKPAAKPTAKNKDGGKDIPKGNLKDARAHDS